MKFLIKILIIISLVAPYTVFAQNLDINKSSSMKDFGGNDSIVYKIKLEKGNLYRIAVMQSKVDVILSLLTPENDFIISTDLADGDEGYDKIEIVPNRSGIYNLKIAAINDDNRIRGQIQVFVKRFDKAEQKRKMMISEDLKTENHKLIQTLDIRHFWEAYDKLKNCKTFSDSTSVIQNLYLDRATDGLKEFAKARDFSAERFVKRIGQYKKYYNAVRTNTLIAVTLYDSLSKVNEALKNIYPNLKAYKVCFAIGPMSTPGTISGDYLLIGTEMEAGDMNMDLSEITNANFKASLLTRNTVDIPFNIKETIAHEAIHVQQPKVDVKATECPLLENIIREGAAEFIASKVTGRVNYNKPNYAYVISHEKELWVALKSELCTSSLKNWLFNASSIKDKPGDLGYALGYMIVEAYYTNALDKTQALKDIIEMDNALLFLEKSGYDLKFRKKLD